jgi:hypothetical protein
MVMTSLKLYVLLQFHSNETTEEEDEMNISQEILVLDFGDEKNHDFLRSDPSTDFGRGELTRANSICIKLEGIDVALL